jgi:hypothetical protein
LRTQSQDYGRIDFDQNRNKAKVIIDIAELEKVSNDENKCGRRLAGLGHKP